MTEELLKKTKSRVAANWYLWCSLALILSFATLAFDFRSELKTAQQLQIDMVEARHTLSLQHTEDQHILTLLHADLSTGHEVLQQVLAQIRREQEILLSLIPPETRWQLEVSHRLEVLEHPK